MSDKRRLRPGNEGCQKNIEKIMKTLSEKITFVLTILAYLIFHLRLGSTLGATLGATFEQFLNTAPYCIGFTYVLVVVLRYMHDGTWPVWDRIVRIFCTIGILFGFYFALYEHGERGHLKQLEQEKQEQLKQPEKPEDKPHAQVLGVRYKVLV
jgi:hypothetical protein